jgi:ATP-dependent helicase HrpB
MGRLLELQSSLENNVSCAPMFPSGLPIDAVLPALRAALASKQSAILQAPPGAGKSTVVPLALLEEPWARGKRLIMLEPRRLAARAVAQRMAQALGQKIGETVGLRMRLDTRVSRATRVEVVTEGVLTRMLQTDPAFEGVAAVIFDEFHERSLQADLGLALALDARDTVAPELKLLVMSATLDGASVARILGDVAVVTADGRMFPVESRYMGKGAPLLPHAGPNGPWDAPERLVSQITQRAAREECGDILVFLPGAREIRRVQALLESAGLPSASKIFALFGDLAASDQDAALEPSPPGTRKIVLATNIAETSLTIEGVRVVVDSGLVRRAVFDPATGMSRLETQRISRASAQQRQGRAGRLEPGVCYRAWSEGAQRSLAPFTSPEIMDADLASLALELAGWGVQDASALRWLDPPPSAMLSSARDLLSRLGALDASGRLTEHGRQMSRVGLHPRLAHMLLRARELGSLSVAAELAAILSERDLLRGAASAKDADVGTRLEMLHGRGSSSSMDRARFERTSRLVHELMRLAGGARDSNAKQISAGVLLAFAYPDRIGRRRPGSEPRYTLANGRGAHFSEAQPLSRSEFIVAVDLDDRERDARILLAAPLARDEIDAYLADRLARTKSIEWSPHEQAVIARRMLRLDAIVLEEKPLHDVPAEAVQAAMLQGVRELGIAALPWEREARDLQARMEFVRRLRRDESWPDVADASLASSLETWLGPWLTGITRREHLTRVSLQEALRALLSWEQRKTLDKLAPTHLEVPSGSRVRIDYLDDSAPAVAVRLQEVFGLEQTPRIGGGAIPITFQLLSPARRPVQVTRDLASFWRGAYADVRKDLRGRYPKHFWPEDPLEAAPIRGVRRRP